MSSPCAGRMMSWFVSRTHGTSRERMPLPHRLQRSTSSAVLLLGLPDRLYPMRTLSTVSTFAWTSFTGRFSAKFRPVSSVIWRIPRLSASTATRSTSRICRVEIAGRKMPPSVRKIAMISLFIHLKSDTGCTQQGCLGIENHMNRDS